MRSEFGLSWAAAEVEAGEPAPRITVVVPCYKVTDHILGVLARIDAVVSRIMVIDDHCPEGSGRLVEDRTEDPRVEVIYHEVNKGVGGAVITGYRAALRAGAEIVIKIDGDGQMDPSLIPLFVAPIEHGEADYVKGNRFHSIDSIREMPPGRRIGNALLSFVTKLSSGYWSVFDPTNGYTAIHAGALEALDLDRISDSYFFETDMLVNLGSINAVVADVPMQSFYSDERSNLRARTVAGEFIRKHIRSFIRRIIYNYYLRDFNIASLYLMAGVVLTSFGGVFGTLEWWRSASSGVPATTGTVMIATLPIILGFQLLLAFLNYDIGNEPRVPLQRRGWPQRSQHKIAPARRRPGR